jgi:hypothetical protein
MVHGRSTNMIFIVGALQVFNKIFKWMAKRTNDSDVVEGWYHKVEKHA